MTGVLLNCPFMSNPFQEMPLVEAQPQNCAAISNHKGVGWATESSLRCSGVASGPERPNRNVQLKFSQKQPHSKRKKKRVNVNNTFYLLNISKVVVFQHVTNIKILKRCFAFFLKDQVSEIGSFLHL